MLWTVLDPGAFIPVALGPQCEVQLLPLNCRYRWQNGHDVDIVQTT